MRGVRSNASFMVSGEPDLPPETIEPYDRSMSPHLIDIMELSAEERGIEIVAERDQLRALVSAFSPIRCHC